MTEREKREKVIRGLECCLGKDNRITHCKQCPYKTEDTVGEYKWPGVCDIDKLHQDALALLKAHEQVRPVRIVEHAQGADIVWYECGGCGGLLGAGKEVKNVCPGCGKKVKWDA